MLPVHREPLWSGPLTAPLAAHVPARARVAVLEMIKAFHTAIFAFVGVSILIVLWDGIRQRPGRRVGVLLGIALAESAIYASNNQVCPLTPLAEELGASSGSVADIFLPDWFSKRIPLFGGSALVVGLALNARALLRRRPQLANVRGG